MICMQHGPRMRKELKLQDDLTVTLPVWVWCDFIAIYQAADMPGAETRMIAWEAQKQILDPVYIREAEAAHQEQRDRAESFNPFALLEQAIRGEEPPNDDPRFGQEPPT